MANCARSTSVSLPARLRFGAGLLEMHVVVHVIDPGERNEVMLAAGVRVVLGELHQIPTFQMIHRSDMNAVGTEHFHVFLDHGWCDHASLHCWKYNSPQSRVVPGVVRRRRRGIWRGASAVPLTPPAPPISAPSCG